MLIKTPIWGQQHPEFPPAVFSNSEDLPKGLLAGKSVIIFKGPEDHWKENAGKVHRKISDYGVDAIAYFHISELNSGIEVRRIFAENLTIRESKFLFLFDLTTDQVILNVTGFNGKYSFYDTGQPSWEIRTTNLDQCLTVFYRKLGQSNLKLRNFLISEVPEFFEDVNVIRANRMEQYARDLKLDKMAVVLLPPISEQDGAAAEEIREYNERLKQDSIEIAGVMQDYPFEYEIIRYTKDEESLRTKGFFFILYQVYNSGTGVKKYLDYKVNPKETAFISVRKADGKPSLKTIPVGQKVYKYYVKHIYTGDVYLGKDWDADPEWTVALKNYIAGLKEATGLK